ncbi:class I SAM-dependent rRNA methyltransferase [Amphibacillus jilinensis]|uniref:class I SAM-dependent rRNA methyltransferase n=1 Tax=Amphibacillus jilinensis TaxID=1216008 RepID=UPI0002F97DC0|nr:class I SAM-dependent rRNA methyltransferase [Amphibacillus jilinensis]
MTQVKINNKFVNKFRNGYPHLFKEAIVDIDQLQEEGTIIDLVDQHDQFIGRGYYGRQNKGYGWLLTNDKDEKINQSFFIQKISAALARRSNFFASQVTTAFRVFNGEGDGIGGLTIDYYADYFLMTFYSDGIYQFKEIIVNAIQQLTVCKAIYEKKRFDTGGKYIDDDDFVTGERANFPIIIKENGIHFAVDLNDGPMTGLFLDQREVRQRILDQYAAGKTVLNTFSYTGAFSVYATMGGAEKTVSVDLANRSLPKTIEQFQVNDLDYTKHEIRTMDVFNYFNYAVKKQLTFDLVILDPPSFARSKKRTFSVAKDYVSLLTDAIAMTKDQGVIVASTNFSGFNIEKFKQMITKAFREVGEQYQFVETFQLPEDFRYHPQFEEGNYLKVVFIKKVANH